MVRARISQHDRSHRSCPPSSAMHGHKISMMRECSTRLEWSMHVFSASLTAFVSRAAEPNCSGMSIAVPKSVSNVFSQTQSPSRAWMTLVLLESCNVLDLHVRVDGISVLAGLTATVGMLLPILHRVICIPLCFFSKETLQLFFESDGRTTTLSVLSAMIILRENVFGI